jgi:hypothetical protein
VGGIAGSTYKFIDEDTGPIIENCVAEGSIQNFGADGQAVGGIVGVLVEGTVINSRSQVDISTTDPLQYVGGIVGINDHGTVAYTEFTGTLPESDLLDSSGGVVGFDDFGLGTISSFFDKTKNPQLPTNIAGGNIGKTTQELMSLETYIVNTPQGQWDISTWAQSAPTTWKICAQDGISYPRLWWEDEPTCSTYIPPIIDGGIESHSGFRVGPNGPGG